MFEGNRKNVIPAEVQGDRRPQVELRKAVLRVGLMEHDGGHVFCLIDNISSTGVELLPYGAVIEGDASLRVSDEGPIPGTVAWSREGLVRLRFKQPLNPQALLRIGQKTAAHRRRLTRRIAEDRRGWLRTGGLKYCACVSDITSVGARLRIADAVSFGETSLLDVQGLPSLSICVRWSDGAEHGVSFQAPLPTQILTDLLSR